jgi:hypothetical protein
LPYCLVSRPSKPLLALNIGISTPLMLKGMSSSIPSEGPAPAEGQRGALDEPAKGPSVLDFIANRQSFVFETREEGQMTSSGNKWALLIGINKYPKLPPYRQLSGCINDVQAMSIILQEKFKFPNSNIITLRDEEATQEGIRKAMDSLSDRVGPDDIVAVHYSGHGSRITDVHGDEPGGMDSTIVPYDSGRRPNPNRDITDDEIHLWLSRLTQVTPYVTLIFDCCHSGTITRDAFGDASRWVEPDKRSVEDIVADGTAFEMPDDALLELKAANRSLGGSGWLALGKNYVLLSGCRDDESSNEHTAEGVTYGAMSYFLGRELFDAPLGTTTYRDVYERASARVTACQPRQHPQLEGRIDCIVFDTQDFEPLRFVPVEACVGSRITLGAGAAHGLTVGSRWAVYPQGTKAVTPETTRSGLVEITAVHAVTSDARLLGPAPSGSITAGCRAIEEAHAYGDMRLVVDVQAAPGNEESLEDLKKCIGESRLLDIASGEASSKAADIRIYLIPPRVKIQAGDPVPELDKIETTSWAAVGRNGKLVMPAHPINEPGVTKLLLDNLEKLSRYRNALALTNPNPDSPLKGKVAFVLKQRRKDGSWEEARPDPVSGQVVFHQDDPIAFEIANKHTEPIYVSVLDFGLTGGISLVYPPRIVSEKFEPGVPPVKIFERDEDRVTLYIPDNFAYDDGIETLKLFATTHKTGFSWLEQETVRGLRDTIFFSSPLAQLFDLAYTGTGTRDARPNTLYPNEEWTTVERTFVLKRKRLQL